MHPIRRATSAATVTTPRSRMRLGAVKVADGRTWVVLRDPSGLLFDVVPYESPWFDERSRAVT